MLLVVLFLFASIFIPVLLLFLSLKALPLFLSLYGVENAENAALAILQAYHAWHFLILLCAVLGLLILIAFGVISILLYLKKDFTAGLKSAGSIVVIMLMYGFLIFAMLTSESIFTFYLQTGADIRQIKNGTTEHWTLTEFYLNTQYIGFGLYSKETSALLETLTLPSLDGSLPEKFYLPTALHFSEQYTPSGDATAQYRISYTTNCKMITEIVPLV